MLAPFGEGTPRLRRVPHGQQLTMRIHLAPQGGKQSSQPRPRLTSALVARREGFEPNLPHHLHDESPYRRWFLQRRFACLSRTATTGAFSPTQL